MRWRLPTVGLLVVAAARAGAADPAQSPALPAVLGLDEALQLFRERGFDLLLADATVESARGDELIARGFANPNLSATVGKTFGYNPDPTCSGCASTAISVGLSDSAVLFDLFYGKRGLRTDVARAALEAAKKSRADAQRTLEFALKQQYFQALIARANLQFAGDTRAAFGRTRALQEKRLELGAISDADLAKVDVAALEAQQAMDQAEQLLAQAKAQLAFLLGAREAPPSFDLEPRQLAFRVPAKLQSVDREALVREARAARPDRQALQLQLERAKASIALSKRQRLPDVTLSVNYAQEGTGANAISPPTLTFGASLPLPIFYQQQGEIVKAEADLRTQDLLFNKLDAQIVSDVSSAAAQVQGTRKLVERMEAGGLLARAKRARDLVEVQYQKGAASLLDLLDAERTYIASHNEYVQDLGNYWIAVSLLEQAVGTELKQ